MNCVPNGEFLENLVGSAKFISYFGKSLDDDCGCSWPAMVVSWYSFKLLAQYNQCL